MQPARQVVYIVFAMILQKLGGLDGQGKLPANFGQQRGHDALPGAFDNVHRAEQSHRVRPGRACVQISIQRLAARIAAQGLDGFRCAAETLVVVEQNTKIELFIRSVQQNLFAYLFMRQIAADIEPQALEGETQQRPRAEGVQYQRQRHHAAQQK